MATAPLSQAGHVNLSPKGLDSFQILSPNRVAYLDLTGSGNETSAHLQENQRITFMFCAFQGPPCILRLYGQGYTVLPTDFEWHALHSRFSPIPGTRQIVVADIDRVQTSCGNGVPLYDYLGEREAIVKWAVKKGDQGLNDYWQQKNLVSIDGLPTPLGVVKNDSLSRKWATDDRPSPIAPHLFLLLETERCADCPNYKVVIAAVLVWIGNPDNTGCDRDVVCNLELVERFKMPGVVIAEAKVSQIPRARQT